MTMSWTTPEIKEIYCGMEINMYAPSEDQGDTADHDLF